MTLFSRYVFRQVANAFVIILVTLTAIVWLATALKQLDLIISQGQGFVLFLKMTFLSLPGLMALIAPNAMQGAMQPLPQIAGAAGAATGCIQMATGAAVSGLVAMLYDHPSALSMTALMAVCSLVALAAYLLLARPAERAIVQA